GDQGRRLDRRLAEAAAQRIVMQEQLVDPMRQHVRRREVAHPYRAARDLVLVRRTDAAPGSADRAGAGTARGARPLARPVELAVQGQDQGRVLGDAQVVRSDRDAARAQRLDLVEQGPGIDHNAVADDRQLARAHHAGRQQAELEGLAVDHQGVAGVVPALEAHHHLGALRQPVDDLPLALVAPLGADHGDVGHVALSSPPAGMGRARPLSTKRWRGSSPRPERRSQNLSALHCLTWGRAQIAISRSSDTGWSTRIRAIASPPGRARPRWKVALLMPASPNVLPSAPMMPGLSSLRTYSMYGPSCASVSMPLTSTTRGRSS